MTQGSFGWTDIDDIAIALHRGHPELEPFQIGFTELREMVEALEGFDVSPQQMVNEQILEAIQVTWQEEIDDSSGPGGDEDQQSGYSPNQPFR